MTARCCQSWSFVGAKMQVKVSIGSCDMGYVCVAFGALNVEGLCSWAVVQNC